MRACLSVLLVCIVDIARQPFEHQLMVHQESANGVHVHRQCDSILTLSMFHATIHAAVSLRYVIRQLNYIIVFARFHWVPNCPMPTTPKWCICSHSTVGSVAL